MRAANISVCPVTRKHAIVSCTVGGRPVSEYRCNGPEHALTVANAYMAVGSAGAAVVYLAIYGDAAPSVPTRH